MLTHLQSLSNLLICFFFNFKFHTNEFFIINQLLELNIKISQSIPLNGSLKWLLLSPLFLVFLCCLKTLKQWVVGVVRSQRFIIGKVYGLLKKIRDLEISFLAMAMVVGALFLPKLVSSFCSLF